MQKNDPKMTNLKAGSGSTVMPVQGPQICPILGDFWWPSNRRFVDPEPSLKGLRSAEKKRTFFFVFKKGPELTSHKGSNVVPKPTVQHIHIYMRCEVISWSKFGGFQSY